MLRSRLLIFKAFLEGVPSVFDVLLFVCCVGFVSFVCFLDVGVCVCWLAFWLACEPTLAVLLSSISHCFVSSQPPVSQSLASDHPPMSLSPLSLASANPTRLSGCQGYGTGSLIQECVNSGPPRGLGFGQSRGSGCQGYGKDRVISRMCKFWSSKGPGFWPK